MAWTNPRTWVTGEVVTAAHMNAHVRDNLTFLYTPPSCSVRRTTDQPVATSNLSAITFDAEAWDTDTMFSATTSSVVVVTAGKYLIQGGVQWQASSTNDRELHLRLNGTADLAVERGRACAASTTNQNISRTYPLAAGDYVQLLGWQDSGTTLSIVSSGVYSPFLQLTRVSA